MDYLIGFGGPVAALMTYWICRWFFKPAAPLSAEVQIIVGTLRMNDFSFAVDENNLGEWQINSWGGRLKTDKFELKKVNQEFWTNIYLDGIDITNSLTRRERGVIIDAMDYVYSQTTKQREATALGKLRNS